MALYRASRLFDVLRKATTPLLALEEPLYRAPPWHAWGSPNNPYPRKQPWKGFPGAGFCSDPRIASGGSSEEAAQLLQSINAFDLRARLEALSEEQLYMSYRDFLREAQETSAGLDEQGAQELCKALVKSGVVLQYRDIVYLRPAEVAEIVLGNLPHKQEEMENKLAALKGRLAPMVEVKRDIKNEARTRSSMYLNAGLLFLVTQFGGFYWLTFHELSWDVMEPVAYFFTLGYGILTYVYFLVKREDFDYLGFRKRVEIEHESKEERKRNFDEVAFRTLSRDIERYERYLDRFKVEALAAEKRDNRVLVGDAHLSQAAAS